ncbi:uncharacterized protein Dwil_GK17626 [Drosophila willistoni]|uniref:Uncharacterized protein n=2 Tax=Drosophila willistoni TaxID=7260 RepID=B4MN28_DROWI|nr:uncharacterized protein Dwil_GK17626 [Drosophila willistoni]
MRQEIEANAQVIGGNGGDYYDYVYTNENGFDDLDTQLDAAANEVLAVPDVAGICVGPECDPISSSVSLDSNVGTTCFPVNQSPGNMETTDPPKCEPPPLPIPTSPPIPPGAPTLPPASSTTVLSCDKFFKNADDQIQPMDNFQQQQRAVDASTMALADGEQRSKELRTLVQHLYVAQARVQLEATEIRKAQAVASTAQSQLEESANHVRSITATLHNAQQEVAAAAIRAQIAQLQLAAHDQLLFAARQDVDALSSQMVGLQAAEGIVQPRLTVDLHALLDKLRQPLQQFDRPTPVPLIVTQPPTFAAQQNREGQQSQGTDSSDDPNGQNNGSFENPVEREVVIQQQPVRYPPQTFNNIHSKSCRAGGKRGQDAWAVEDGGQYVNIEFT